MGHAYGNGPATPRLAMCLVPVVTQTWQHLVYLGGVLHNPGDVKLVVPFLSSLFLFFILKNTSTQVFRRLSVKKIPILPRKDLR